MMTCMKQAPKIIATANGNSVEVRHENFDVGGHYLTVSHVLAAAISAVAFARLSIKPPVVHSGNGTVSLDLYGDEGWANTADGVAHAINNTPSLALYVQAAVAVLGGVR